MEAQRRVLDAFDLDRASLFQLSGDDDLVLTHHWSRPGQTPPASSPVSAARVFPWSLARVLNGEIAAFSSVGEIPDEAEQQAVRHYGTASRVAFRLAMDVFAIHEPPLRERIDSIPRRTWPRCNAMSGRAISKLSEVEKAHIQSVLESVGWRIRGPAGAADRRGLPPTTLETRMAKLGLSRPKAEP